MGRYYFSLVATILSFAMFAGVARADGLSDTALERVYSVGKSYTLAQEIAKRCRSIRLRNGTRRTVERYLLNIGKEEGVGKRGMMNEFRKIPPARVQDDMLGYISKRNIVIADRSTWCAAGRAEISAGGQIANFLSER